MAAQTYNLGQRFWSKVKKTPTCWLWTASKLIGGYGQAVINGQRICSHRVMWSAIHGRIPKGMCVLHKCDNPPCVRPSHLFLGTHKLNSLDAIAKARHAHGQTHYAAILTDKKVREMRRLHRLGVGPAMLGRCFGIHTKHASLIVQRKRWKHIA